LAELKKQLDEKAITVIEYLQMSATLRGPVGAAAGLGERGLDPAAARALAGGDAAMPAPVWALP